METVLPQAGYRRRLDADEGRVRTFCRHFRLDFCSGAYSPVFHKHQRKVNATLGYDGAPL
jgi:hypothetical protein